VSLFSNLFKLYLFPDQIDGFDYYNNLNSNLTCCIENISFHSNDIINVNSNATWEDWAQGGTNPFTNIAGNVFQIKKSIYIKPGVTLTIKNLTLEFAPDARIVVENGTSNSLGGKLILDGTTLKVVETCGINSNWLGCEVWGNKNLNQLNINSTNQGILIMKNNSTIKDAVIGVLVGKRQLNNINSCPSQEIVSGNVFAPTNSGGIIKISNSNFENNITGIRFEKYFSPNGINNISTISTSTLKWDDNINSSYLNYHIHLKGVKGLRIIASNFKNDISNNSNLVQSGIGIYSENSNFSVESKCNYIPNVGGNCNWKKRSY
jgi:hypothetical protein